MTERELNAFTDKVLCFYGKYRKIKKLLETLYQSYNSVLQTEREEELFEDFMYDIIDGLEENASDDKPCYVYYILNADKDKVKIGISDNPTGRAKALQTACGEDLEILHTIEFENRESALNAERYLHGEFREYRMRVSKVSKSCEWFEADNFNIVRQITVINCIQNDVLFQMSGKMSITADREDNQLEIIVEDNGRYSKHFIGLSDNVTYVVEDLNLGANEVSKYRYYINYNPKMWIPGKFKSID